MIKKFDWIGFIPVILLILLWEISAKIGIFSKEIFPPPAEVVKQFYLLIKNKILLVNFLASFKRVIIGFLTGSVSGIFIGILIGWHKHIDRIFSPLISILYPIPALGWLPILMLLIGINEVLPILIIFICSFFPVVYTTTAGIKNVDRNFIEVARTLGASKWNLLKKIVFPLALPYIFTGLRLEAGMAWRVIIAAEMIAIPTGIGSLMMRAENLIRMDVIIVCLFVLSIMTFIFEKILLCLEKRISYNQKPKIFFMGYNL